MLLTLRADYAHIVQENVGWLHEYLKDTKSIYRLKSPSKDALREMVVKPLKQSGYDDDTQASELATRIIEDISNHPGDLAVAQMAMHLSWRDRYRLGDSLLAAYAALGGILGALEEEAERVFHHEITTAERALVMPIFLRLVKLGETAGAIRRVALLKEFSKPQKKLIDRLASEECGRLL